MACDPAASCLVCHQTIIYFSAIDAVLPDDVPMVLDPAS